MRSKTYLLLLAAALLLQAQLAFGQFNATLGTHGRTNAGITNGISIGNVTGAPAPFQAFQVRGDLFGLGGNGEVFRTNATATAGGRTSWRMFHGATGNTLGAGFERGQLFAEQANSHFNINAPNGHFRLYTNTIERARLNSTLTGTIGQFANVNRDGFMLVSGEPDAFTNASSRAPFTRLHLVDDIEEHAPCRHSFSTAVVFG